ncbi:MAG: protein jag [Lachnospiraceae bacterium]|nr:protein jag [Lachnospiraceae bacterium]
MSDWKKYTGATVDEAFTKACIELGLPSSELEMVVTQKESAGLLGLFKKEAEIQVRAKKAAPEVKEVKTEAPAKKVEEPKKQEVKTPVKEEKPQPVKKEEPKKAEKPVVTEVKEEVKAEEPIEAPKKPSLPSTVNVVDFLKDVLSQMGIDADVVMTMDEENETMNIEIQGDNMGLLIGKRGQTLDALQYLASLIVNKGQESYTKVKVDTENYRERRKATLENLAKNIASKVKKTHRAVTLEPMNPYERRIIHAALQGDRYVDTHSEGDEPNRSVVVTLKKEFRDYDFNNRRGGRGKGYNNNRNGNRKNNRYNNNRRYNKKEQNQNQEAAPAAEE